MDTVMQRENERGRLAVDGHRTDDGECCSLLMVHEVGGKWAISPHGASQLGVRLAKAEAVQVAEAILAGAR